MDKKQFYTKIAHLIIYYLGNVTFYHTSSQHASNHQSNNDPDGYGKESFIVFLPEELNQCKNEAEDSQWYVEHVLAPTCIIGIELRAL